MISYRARVPRAALGKLDMFGSSARNAGAQNGIGSLIC
jgi:hypothetical protein